MPSTYELQALIYTYRWPVGLKPHPLDHKATLPTNVPAKSEQGLLRPSVFMKPLEQLLGFHLNLADADQVPRM